MPSQLKRSNVVYTRTYENSKKLEILFIGETKMLTDIELLLEDNWTGILTATSEEDALSQIQNYHPRVCVFEYGVFSGSEIRLVETIVPASVTSIVVTNRVTDQLAWKRVSRQIGKTGGLSIELSEEPSEAAKELEEVISGLARRIEVGLDEDIRNIKTASEGFKIGNDQLSSIDSDMVRFLFSQVVLDPVVLNSAVLLAETVDLWKSPKLANSNLSFSYHQLEQRVAGTPAEAILKLVCLMISLERQGKSPTEEEWKKMVKEAGCGKLLERQLVREHQKLSSLLIKSRIKLKIVA